MLSRVPERLETINKGLRTLHFYEIAVSPHDPDVVIGGTQDNGSWERSSGDTWVNTNIADGGHNAFDIGDPNFRLTSWQQGQLMVRYTPQNQVDVNWIADTPVRAATAAEAVAFIGPATNDPRTAGWLWTAREHVFRSTNYGRNPDPRRGRPTGALQRLVRATVDVNEDGTYEPSASTSATTGSRWAIPGAAGRLTGPAYGAATDRCSPEPQLHGGRRAGHVDGTLWAATSAGRVFVSKNAHDPNPATVVFDRIDNDPTAGTTPPRYPTAIYVDPKDANHAWITYSGFNAKTPATPGHVFEVRYVAERLDLHGARRHRDELRRHPGELDRRHERAA